MTVTNNSGTEISSVEMITAVIDDVAVQVPKGTLVIRAAELIGNEIPRFCDHPLLDPVAACRACLIEVEGMPKPQPACAQVLADGMVVRTQRSSAVAQEAQQGVMEFLLVNHPLDCPVCDKGGECPLQNQAMTAGRDTSRFDGDKRNFEKPINVSAEILLDRERCVSCARCTRFADQIAGDPMIELLERGARQQVGTAADEPFDSYFSGNTVQICPVGALTAASYRFRSRPFDLVSVPTTCEHCASGCSLRTDFRRGTVTRRLAWDDPSVNEEWNCDKGRFAFAYQHHGRITTPLIRENGELRPASWPEALSVAAAGLKAAGNAVGVLAGGRLTNEDAYAYSRFARAVIGTDSIDFRARPSSDEEAELLMNAVAGTPVTVTYESLQSAKTVLLVAFEPEDESPIVFLRLRKAVRAGTSVHSIGPVLTRGLAKLSGTLVPSVPGAEAQVIANLNQGLRDALSQPGAVILVGERIASIPGGASAVLSLAQATGAGLAWVPRRAGERGALDAGALAGLLPGGRPLADEQARQQVADAWGIDVATLPAEPGYSGDRLLTAAATGDLRALIAAGVDPGDFADPSLAAQAIAQAEFVVSLEHHHSQVTEQADVVLPVAVVTEKPGSFTTWEGRSRPFGQVLRDALMMSDASVLGLLAAAMNAPISGFEIAALRREFHALGNWQGWRPDGPAHQAASAASGTTLATWRFLLDAGTLQDDEPHLAATARPAVAMLSSSTVAAMGNPQTVTITGPHGALVLPVEIAHVVDDVVVVPMNSTGCAPARDLGAGYGSPVTLTAGGQV